MFSYTILTTNPSKKFEELHNRMPVILAPDEWRLWADPDQRDTGLLEHLMRPADDSLLELRAVSRLVNNANNEGAALLEADAEAEAAAPPATLTLFD